MFFCAEKNYSYFYSSLIIIDKGLKIMQFQNYTILKVGKNFRFFSVLQHV